MAHITPDNRVAFLGVHPIFARLTVEQRREIAAAMGEHRFRAGETIFLAGDPADRLYIIVSGTVRINIISEDGREAALNYMRQGDIFGEIALLDNRNRTASAVAVIDCHFLSIARKPFIDLLSGNGDLVAAIFTVLVDRLRHMSSLVQTLVLRPLEARIAFVLLLLADKHGVRTIKGIEIGLKISDTDIGNLAHASRPTVSSELKRLRDQGVITREKRRYIVLDREALARIVHSSPPMEMI